MTIMVNGFCDERFAPLRDAFIGNFDAGLEIGSSLALTYRGKPVVDLWAGYADLESKRPWEKDTIAPVFSTTKIITAMCAFMLIDRGKLKLDDKISHYWPEFAQGGKQQVTVRDALSHQSGVPGLAQPEPWQIQKDWEAVTARIAAEPHWFGGERRLCYHMSTYGFIVGELIRRADGRRPAQFFREEIAQKIGADFQIGLTERSESARVATVRMVPPQNPEAPNDIARRISESFVGTAPLSSWEFQSWEHPAGSGYAHGRSIARVVAIMAMGGELDGVRYFSKDLAKEAGTEQIYEQTPMGTWLRMGLTFGLDSKEFPAPTPTSIHWGGFGGSWIFADPRAQVSLGYAPNNFLMGIPMLDPRLACFAGALKDLLPTL